MSTEDTTEGGDPFPPAALKGLGSGRTQHLFERPRERKVNAADQHGLDLTLLGRLL